MRGAGLAGATLLGAAGCGGGTSGSGVVFTYGPDTDGTVTKLVNEFNKQNKGGAQVTYRQMPADTGQYYDKLRTEFQAGTSDVSVIGSDVIWPKQFASHGWTIDLTKRFPPSEQKKFVGVTIDAASYKNGIYA